jgi:hypothetical protein
VPLQLYIRDLRTPIAALRDESPIAQASHQHDPGTRAVVVPPGDVADFTVRGSEVRLLQVVPSKQGERLDCFERVQRPALAAARSLLRLWMIWASPRCPLSPTIEAAL